jgi:deferrochelatase/peroxidase EfeB
MMGRWRDGTPLVLSPEHADPELATKRFDYQDDAAGIRCPFAAHIRIMNPRDQELDSANRTMFPNGPPRIIRRGHTYGPGLAPDAGQDDGVDRGIIGLFVCSNINRQFYTLTRWIGQTRFSPVFKNLREQDPLFGNRNKPLAEATYAIPHPETPVKLTGLRNFIRTQGTLLLLLPSIETLRRLAADR